VRKILYWAGVSFFFHSASVRTTLSARLGLTPSVCWAELINGTAHPTPTTNNANPIQGLMCIPYVYRCGKRRRIFRGILLIGPVIESTVTS
jgi:hypothetical protein